ncbi:hypothetical protein B0J14DRAFT_492263 [Halenospora varia]|nr:hypothetical protein B0J14DRAFT_492263 [Halenospora varia]
MAPQCESQQLLKLQNWWTRSRRKPAGKDHSRIEWTCECGHDLFADFKTNSPELLSKYASIPKHTPSGSSPSTTSQSRSSTMNSPPPIHLQHSNSANFTIQSAHTLNNMTPASTLQSLSGTTLSGSINANVNLSFLELCVNTGPHLKSLAEIDTAHISTDGALFKSLRQQYLNLRGFRSRFWLLKPAAVSFVRFSLENRHRVGILQKPLALPPKSEVDAKNWVYDPCPLEGDPPIAEDLFLHYLQCNEGSGNLFWMFRFPRKLDTSLLKPNASATFGWGIHIDEGPDYAALFKANFIVLCLSGLAAWLWSFFKHDFQGAFIFGCWIIAVLNSLLMAYMFKWRQE